MIEKIAVDFINQYAFVSENEAIDASMKGLRLMDDPIVGYASASDPLFNEFKNNHRITYGNFVPPLEWLDSAKTVISIFFPFSEMVTKNNSTKAPSPAWLHARYEGQMIINKCTEYIISKLKEKGFKALAPSLDSRFKASAGTGEQLSNDRFHSNWSERHVAYAAGLGTFRSNHQQRSSGTLHQYNNKL